MQRFEIQVPDAVLEDLRERLARTRFPDQIDGSGWSYGTDLDYLRELVEYWRTQYDWREWEAVLNGFDHFKTDVDGLEMHFIHVRSKHEDALPLLITHGWPGSVFEFHKIIGPLTDPESHGGTAADAFHVVCPSMPGYGWSQAPGEPGFDIQQVATWHSRLMAELGYHRYLAQGGDWGAIASAYIGRDDAEHCLGVHVNMVLGFPPENDPTAFDGLTEQELAGFAAITEFFQKETGYQQIQGTKPQTLGYGLNDSPAGLCAWIVEKFHGWSDCNGHPENAFTRDELLTNVMIYWVTESITSSTRLYCESMRSGRFTAFEGRCGVPTAAAVFPREIIRPPRKWAERMYDIRQWNEFPAGGHFAALEQPQTLVEDVRLFARTLR